MYAYRMVMTGRVSDCVRVHQAHIHALLHTTKGVWEWVTVKLLLTSRHNQTFCYPVLCMWWRRCQRSDRSLFLAAFIMHDRKSPPQSTWSMFTKPNGTVLIRQQRAAATVCLGLCSCPYVSMCDSVHKRSIDRQYSGLSVKLWMDKDAIH